MKYLVFWKIIYIFALLYLDSYKEDGWRNKT